MALTIGTNASSLAAQRSLISSQSDLQTSFERLSSGSRINSAKDDAAGLGIASRLKAQASGAAVAQRNAANAISLVETADAAMSKVSDMLTRARDLRLQYTDGTLSDTDKLAIAAELSDISTAIDNVANVTFGGISLADGSLSVSVAIDSEGTTTALASTFDATATTYDIGTATSIANIDSAIDAVNKQRAELGALANTMQSTIETQAAVEQGLQTSAGRIMDTDFARESANLAKNQILQQAGTSVLAQANATSQNVLSLLQ